jgi:hypothetical protein
LSNPLFILANPPFQGNQIQDEETLLNRMQDQMIPVIEEGRFAIYRDSMEEECDEDFVDNLHERPVD